MMLMLKKAQAFFIEHTILCFRVILFLVFTGHGFVSLGYSPGYELHFRIAESVNIFNWDIPTILKCQGSMDLLLAVLILLGLLPRLVLSWSIIYLSFVALAGYAFYFHKTGSLFGIAESFRRFAWIFYAIFLWFYYNRQKKIFSLLRVGIGFAFLAHGFASLGFFGLKGAHVELASQVLPEDWANTIVYYSGFSDTALGFLMVLGIFSRPAAAIGSVWLVVVVYLSALLAFPDAIFRTGFLLSCIYVAMDIRCHNYIWKKGVIETDPQVNVKEPA